MGKVTVAESEAKQEDVTMHDAQNDFPFAPKKAKSKEKGKGEGKQSVKGKGKGKMKEESSE